MGCCSGSTFSTAPDAALSADQRVNYTFGMVLGVDDFKQEHAWLAGRYERALRETIGYGIVSGLDVIQQVDGATGAIEVRIAPGLAICPDGKLVAVAAAQCATLDEWLSGPGKPTVASPPLSGPVSVYIVLRHAEQTGTPVPIPGEPCRDESSLLSDSRIADSFSLEFSWTAPKSTEDDALREFASYLRRIPVNDNPPAGNLDVAGFQDALEKYASEAVKAAWPATVHPPLAAIPKPLPDPPANLVIPFARYAEYITAAFDVWIRKLRALYLAKHGPVPPLEASAETGLLLAAIDFNLGVDGLPAPLGSPPNIAVRQLGRPQLIHLRLLQEWLLTNAENDAPREAFYVLGNKDNRLPNAQDLNDSFKGNDHALALIDLSPDKARIKPAQKWHDDTISPVVFSLRGTCTGDYYGPHMNTPILVTDGGTGQSNLPGNGQILVGQNQTFTLADVVGKDSNRNITVEHDATNFDIVLNTVQDIDTEATPTFGGLTVNGNTTLNTTVLNGPVTLNANSLTLKILAADGNNQVVAANRWAGDLNIANLYYAPGQASPVRIEDGGTGLNVTPPDAGLLIGLNNAYVQGHVVAKTPEPNLTVSQLPNGDIQLDTIQALHTKATPTFNNVILANPPTLTGATPLGWNSKTGEIVQTTLPGGNSDPSVWKIRIIDNVNAPVINASDQILVYILNNNLVVDLPALGLVPDGKILILKNATADFSITINNIERSFNDATGTFRLSIRQSVTVIASRGAKQWLVIARVTQ